MKRLITIIVILVMSVVVNKSTAQTLSAVASIQNVQVIGSSVTFDVYLKNTSTATFYLSDSDFILDFDLSKFTSVTTSTFTASSAFSGLDYWILAMNVYTFGTTGTIDIQIGPNTYSTTTLLQVSSIGNGSYIGTVTLNTITNFSGTPNLNWSSLYTNFISAYDPPSNTSPQVAPQILSPIPSLTLGPIFDAIITNQQVVSGAYYFDIYLKRNGVQNFYLDDCDFKFTLNGASFSATNATVQSKGTAKLSTYYTYQSPVINGTTLTLSINSAFPLNNQSEFNTKIEDISNIGNGTKIATMKIINANNNPVNPNWVSGIAATLIQNRRNVTGWGYDDDITANGTYIVMPPVTSITINAPVGGESYCPGSVTTITWTSLNVTNVKIDLVSGASVTSITNSTSALTGAYTWTVPNLPGTNYVVKITDVSNAAMNTSSSIFTINRQPTISSGPIANSTIACVGSLVSFTMNAVGSGLGYQWYKNGVVIASANLSVYTMNTVTTADAGSYSCSISGTCSPSVSSGSVALTILALPSITTQPIGTSANVGQSVTFAVVATGASLTYQWLKSGTPITGATLSSYTISTTAQTDEGNYSVVVSGACSPTTTSNVAVLFVIPQYVTVTVKAYIQGYLNAGTLVQVKTPVAIELTTGATLSASTSVAIMTGILSSSGNISLNFQNLPSGNYWIIVRHGGALAVGSVAPVGMIPGGTYSYDFTTAAAQTNNGAIVMIGITTGGGTVYALRMGDLNGDRTINAGGDGIILPPNFGLGITPTGVPTLK